MNATNSDLSRRTLAKGAAWAVPAVAVAAAAPQVAASCIPEVTLNVAQSCKDASAKSYYLVFAVSGTNGCDLSGDCSAIVSHVATVNGTSIWSGTPTSGGIKICNSPSQPNKLYVTATITCGGTAYDTKVYEVTAPQVNSGKCLDPEFCPGIS